MSLPAQRSVLGALWRLVRAVVHVVQALWIIRTQFPRLSAEQRTERIRGWSLDALRIFGAELVVHGEPPLSGPVLLVSNHVSWLDILVMNAGQPARFVSKADVKSWPLLGSLITGAGTLYIERENRRDAMRVVHNVADGLRAHDLIAIFPEGTTGDGRTMLPFHANLFQAAIAAEAPVVPVALKFVHADTGECHDGPTYIGDTTLLGSIWATLRATDVRAVLTYAPAQQAHGRDRRTWAQQVRLEIAQLLSVN